MLAARKTYLITARARKNKRTARMLASARKDHSLPLLRWLIHIINPVDKTQLSRYTSHRRSTTVSLETYSSSSTSAWLLSPLECSP